MDRCICIGEQIYRQMERQINRQTVSYIQTVRLDIFIYVYIFIDIENDIKYINEENNKLIVGQMNIQICTCTDCYIK